MKKILFIISLVYLLTPLKLSAQKLISLGIDCQAASRLKQYGLRIVAYPLDWVKTADFDGVCRLIDEQFVYYLAPRFLEHRAVGSHHVFNTRYGIKFIHDFPTDRQDTVAIEKENAGHVTMQFLNFVDQVAKKYAPRIRRFMDAIHGTEEVIFFRTRINKQEAQKFVKLMAKKNPQLHYTLVVVHDDKALNHDWNMHHVKNFYIKKYDNHLPSWFFNEEWLKIFKQLALVESGKAMDLHESDCSHENCLFHEE